MSVLAGFAVKWRVLAKVSLTFPEAVYRVQRPFHCPS